MFSPDSHSLCKHSEQQKTPERQKKKQIRLESALKWSQQDSNL